MADLEEEMRRFPEAVRVGAREALASLKSETTLSELLAALQERGAAPGVRELTCLLVLQQFAPEGEATDGLDLRVEREHGARLEAADFAGDEFAIARSATS